MSNLNKEPIKSGYVFNRLNSKGQAIFRRDTNETLEEVENYLMDKDIDYDVRGSTMLWIRTLRGCYSYYYTTGRWSPYIPRGATKNGYPKKHYNSKGISDFVERFATKKDNYEM
tara:strand:+ start:206 stop:547 length:342 start_codon:yes stop_codon:yes gene_type:complete